jgi:DNA-binding CsgD family transcriptional regulator
MAITIQEIQKQWGVSRATVYKHIKSGKLSRLADGLVDVSEVLRVYGEPSKNTLRDSQATAFDTPETKLLIARIYSLELQLSQAEKRENWLKGQIEKAQQEVIQLLEHKPKTQKGLFNRVIGAIRNN